MSSSDLIHALQSTGMLIRLSTSSFGTQVTDKVRSREVTDEADASNDAARVVLNKLPGNAKRRHQKLKQLLSHARNTINESTTEWDASGYRLLMTSRFDHVMKEIVKIKTDFDAEILEMEKEAPSIIAAATANLGKLAPNIAHKLPTASEMVRAYSMKWAVMPIPDGANFKGLPDSTKEVLSNVIAKRAEEAYENGVTSIVDRLVPVIQDMVERLDRYDWRVQQQAAGQQIGREGAFRDSVTNNFKPIEELVRAMAKVKDDPRLTALGDHLKAITQHTPQELRDSDNIRAGVKQKANDVLAFIDSWTLPGAAQ